MSLGGRTTMLRQVEALPGSALALRGELDPDVVDRSELGRNHWSGMGMSQSWPAAWNLACPSLLAWLPQAA